MEDKLRLRPYRRGDADTIVTWIDNEEAFGKWTAGRMGPFPLTPARLNDALAARDDSDRFFPYTAVVDDRPVGFFILRRPGDDPEVLRAGFVIVDASIRGKGYGKRMMLLAQRCAFGLWGAKRLTLGVFDSNPGARHCYAAAGFRETGESEEAVIFGHRWRCIEVEALSPDL